MSFLSDLIAPATELAGKFIQDKDQAARLAHELSTMADRHAQQALLAQIEVNKAEAASGSVFKGGWRPFIGWVCGAALLYNFVLRDLLAWLILNTGIEASMPPDLAMDELLTVLLGMLGLGAFRTAEKMAGKAR